jgi:hypothetical protein
MIPRGLIISTVIGIIAGGVFGVFFVNLKNIEQLEFVEGASLSIITDKTDFKQGEIIQIRIINSGTVPLIFSDSSYGLQITGLDGRVIYSPRSTQVISTLEPKEEKIFEWDQTKNDGISVLEGTYKVVSSAADDEENVVKKSISINIFK